MRLFVARHFRPHSEPPRGLSPAEDDFSLTFAAAAATASGRGTANGFDFAVSISIVRGPQNGSQSFGGVAIPQTFPGSSSSTAVSNTPPCRPATHFTRPRADTGFASVLPPFNSRITSAFDST